MDTHHIYTPEHGMCPPSWLENIENVSLRHDISKSWSPMAGLKHGGDPTKGRQYSHHICPPEVANEEDTSQT